MTEDKRQSFLGAQVREPIPGKDTFDGNHHILTIGRNGVEKHLRASFHIAMQHNLAVAVQDTDVHGAGMEINATVKLMLLGVESHEVSSSP
jgi:hypothetical protein